MIRRRRPIGIQTFRELREQDCYYVDKTGYNPYDVLLLRRGEYAAHWFETGTPAFLVDKLFERRVSSVSLDETVSTAELLSAFDVHHIGTEALLFQTGFLTITAFETADA